MTKLKLVELLQLYSSVKRMLTCFMALYSSLIVMANPNFAEAKSLRKCQTWFLMQENEAIGVLKKHIYEKLGAFNTFDLINSGTHFGHGDDFEIFGWDFVFKISGQAIGAKNQTLRYFNSQVTPCGDVTEIEIPESEISKYE